LALLSALLIACQAPADKLAQQARELQLHWRSVPGDAFRHTVLLNSAAAAVTTAKSRLHVYLGGDGDPWLNRTTIAADPTARDPLAIHLLARDPSPALYLGRPCYDGLAQDRDCSPLYWTRHRYSEAVVSSMAAALKQLPLYTQAERIVLIGYSGGGTLAMLLAARLPRLDAVITLAGNLDHSAWTQWHGYSPLSGSLNPAFALALPENIIQLHFIAAQDSNIPPSLFPTTLLQRDNARMILLQEYTHRCCWLRDWRNLLEQINQIVYFESIPK